MSSFAIWIKPKEINGKKTEISVHFNYWYAYGSKGNREDMKPILDVGILLEDFSNVNEVDLYLPLAINERNIFDLGRKLNDNVTLNAVFNDSHHISRSSTGKAFLVSESEDENGGNFLVYMLDAKQDVKIEKNPFDADESGCLVKILLEKLSDLYKMSEDNDCRRCYFRLRFESEQFRDCLMNKRNYSFMDALFHDVLAVTKVLEFRLNHSRSLPLSLRERVRGDGGLPQIKALHFFLLTDETVDLLNDQKATIRRLENHVWKNYTPQNPSKKDYSNVIAYHWKDKSAPEKGITGWDLYAKLTFLQRKKVALLIYVIALVLFGAIGSALWQLIWFLICLIGGLQ